MKKILIISLLCLLFVCGCGLTTTESSPIFVTENISKISFKFGPWEEVEVASEDMEEITEWLETFKIGDRVKHREEQPAGTNSVSVIIEYLDGTIIKNGLDTAKLDKKEYHLIYADEPECYMKMYNSVGLETEVPSQDYFNAVVLEIKNGVVLAECTECESGAISVGSQVSVNLDTVSSEEIPLLVVGDTIRVVYIGEVMESDPLKLQEVISIFWVDPNGEIVTEGAEIIEIKHYPEEKPEMLSIDEYNERYSQ